MLRLANMESHKNPESSSSAEEAREALQSIADIRRETAQSAASPRGFYALEGVLEGLLIAAVGIEHSIRFLIFCLGMSLVFAGMRWYITSTGSMTCAHIWEPWAWRAWLMVGIALVALIFASTLGQAASIVGGIVTAISWAIIGPFFDRSWVRRIEEQP